MTNIICTNIYNYINVIFHNKLYFVFMCICIHLLPCVYVFIFVCVTICFLEKITNCICIIEIYHLSFWIIDKNLYHKISHLYLYHWNEYFIKCYHLNMYHCHMICIQLYYVNRKERGETSDRGQRERRETREGIKEKRIAIKS